MKQLLGALQAGLVFALGGIPQLNISDDYKTIATFVVGIVNVMLAYYLAPSAINLVKGAFHKS